MAKKPTPRTVKVKGTTSAEKPLVAAAKKAAREGDNGTTAADLAANVRIVKEEHTRLAEHGETPETRTGEFETKVELGPDKETHTRLATPSDPEAIAQQKEVMAARKASGDGPIEKVQNAKDLPNAGDSPKEARAKQQAQFDKADEAGKAELLGDISKRNAALGSGF